MGERPTGPARDLDGVFRLGGAPLGELLARASVATPAYVYDLDAIAETIRALVSALGPDGLCCYAIKANGAAPVVRTIVAAGAGIDVVSGGELRLAIACGARPESIVYSGVAKRDDELDLAIGQGIKAIHAESVEEIDRIAARARAAGRVASIGLRVNPSVDIGGHAHIATGHDEAKFGIAIDDLPRALASIRGNAALRLVGISSHVGSMLLDLAPYAAAATILGELARDLRNQGFPLAYVDAGGGFGIAYRDDQQALPGPRFVEAARRALAAAGIDLPLVIEPGRSLVAPFGVLVASVIQPKRSRAGGIERRWLLIDAGMNDLIRPALYQAHHRIEPLVVRPGEALVPWRVAGPVCESSDDFGIHPIPDPPPEVVVIRDAGAYGRTMASTYNARPLAAEIFVSGGAIVETHESPGVEALVAAVIR